MTRSFAKQVAALLKRLKLEHELLSTNAELVNLINYDSLTGLPNRTLFADRLSQASAQARRSGESVGLLYLDLDGFKVINDSLGHSFGDELLKRVAERLRHCTREGDTVARLGGDEFALILSNLDTARNAARVAQKILSHLNQPLVLKGREFHLGASIGIVTYPHDGVSSEDLLKNADAAMYRAKALGKNRYHFFTAELNERLLADLSLEQDMRRGLEQGFKEGEFSLVYQPRVHLQTGQVTSLEALARWQHADLGAVSPGRFIPLAERTGLIQKLGREVLLQACRQAKAWQQGGLTIRMAVNLSVKQLQQPSIVADIREVLDQSGLEPQLLELEITESAAMTDVETTIKTLSELRAMGVYLSIDDFGTAYSSLNYLKRLPVNSLKIDKSFLQDVTTRGLSENCPSADAAIVGAVVALGKSMNFTLIAEGVETETQLAFLRELGCDEAQGYLFSQPVSAAEVPSITNLNLATSLVLS